MRFTAIPSAGVAPVALLLLIPLLLFLLLKKYRVSKERAAFLKENNCKEYGPRYPARWWLFGYDFMFDNGRDIVNRRFAQGVKERFEKYGTTYYSYIGVKGIVNTIDPENLEAVFRTNFDDYTIIPARAKLVKPLFGSGIFSNGGQAWKDSRNLVHLALGSTQLDQAVFERNAVRLIEIIKSHGSQPFDFAKLSHGYTLNLATESFFGQSFVSLSDNERQIRQFGQDFENIGRMARWLTIFNGQTSLLRKIAFRGELDPAITRVAAFVKGRVLSIMNSRHDAKGEKSRGRKQTTIIEGLVEHTSDVTRIQSECLNLFLAAKDTVGISLSETLSLLSRHPDVWTRVREEVNAVTKDEPLTFAHLKHLTYLKHVIHEALRLQPTLSVHGRVAIRDTVLPRGGGPDGEDRLLVKKGNYLLYSLYALNRNAAVFGQDCLQFRPERWTEINPDRFEYLDFGAGPRQCPGKHMGWTMVAYALARMAQEFSDIKSCDDRPWEEATAFSFFNRNGTKISVNSS